MSRKPGKKIDVFSFTEGATDYAVELRLVGDGFYAELQGQSFENRDLYDLKKALRDRAREINDYRWVRYIEVECDVNVRGHGSSAWGKSIAELGEDDEVVSVGFKFKIVDRTQPVKTDREHYSGRPMYAYLEHEVHDRDGELTVAKGDPQRHSCTLEHKTSKVPADHPDVIPFTDARYATLQSIRGAMKVLAQRLHDVVGGEPSKAAAMIDGFKAGLLLSAPKAP